MRRRKVYQYLAMILTAVLILNLGVGDVAAAQNTEPAAVIEKEESPDTAPEGEGPDTVLENDSAGATNSSVETKPDEKGPEEEQTAPEEGNPEESQAPEITEETPKEEAPEELVPEGELITENPENPEEEEPLTKVKNGQEMIVLLSTEEDCPLEVLSANGGSTINAAKWDPETRTLSISGNRDTTVWISNKNGGTEPVAARILIKYGASVAFEGLHLTDEDPVLAGQSLVEFARNSSSKGYTLALEGDNSLVQSTAASHGTLYSADPLTVEGSGSLSITAPSDDSAALSTMTDPNAFTGYVYELRVNGGQIRVERGKTVVKSLTLDSGELSTDGSIYYWETFKMTGGSLEAGTITSLSYKNTYNTLYGVQITGGRFQIGKISDSDERTTRRQHTIAGGNGSVGSVDLDSTQGYVQTVGTFGSVMNCQNGPLILPVEDRPGASEVKMSGMIQGDMELLPGCELYIPADMTLSIGRNSTLTNNGVIYAEGRIENIDRIVGNPPILLTDHAFYEVAGGAAGTDYVFRADGLHILTQTALTITPSDSGKDADPRIWIDADNSAVTIKDVTAETGGPLVKIADGKTVGVTLDSCTLTSTGNAAIQNNKGTLNVTLKGNNTLTAGAGHAALEVNHAASVTITGDGNLTATGEDGGAGIGGASGQVCGSIHISGGVIHAAGGGKAAGIGSGRYGYSFDEAKNAGYPGGAVTIDGDAVVNASSQEGCGIGGGLDLSGNQFRQWDLTWTQLDELGIEMTQDSLLMKVAIGGNAKVTAQGGASSAAIGGGFGYTASDCPPVNLTVSESAEVRLKGGKGLGDYLSIRIEDTNGKHDYAAMGSKTTIKGNARLISEGSIVPVSKYVYYNAEGATRGYFDMSIMDNAVVEEPGGLRAAKTFLANPTSAVPGYEKYYLSWEELYKFSGGILLDPKNKNIDFLGNSSYFGTTGDSSYELSGTLTFPSDYEKLTLPAGFSMKVNPGALLQIKNEVITDAGTMVSAGTTDVYGTLRWNGSSSLKKEGSGNAREVDGGQITPKFTGSTSATSQKVITSAVFNNEIGTTLPYGQSYQESGLTATFKTADGQTISANKSWALDGTGTLTALQKGTLSSGKHTLSLTLMAQNAIFDDSLAEVNSSRSISVKDNGQKLVVLWYFTVEKTALPEGFRLEKTEITYSAGNNQVPVIAPKGLTAGVDYQAAYYNTAIPGKATVVIRGIGSYTGQYSLNYTIKGTVKLTFQAAPYSFAYNGSARPLSTADVKVTTEADGGERTLSSSNVTLTYYKGSELTTAENSGARTKGGAPRLPGTYTVKAALAAQGYYEEAETSCELTIEKMVRNIYPASGSKVSVEYTGEPVELTTDLFTIYGNDWTADDVSFEWVDGALAEGPVVPGDYSVKVTVKETDLFNEATKTMTVTVEKLTPIITLKVFADGKPLEAHSVLCTYGDKVTLTVEGQIEHMPPPQSIRGFVDISGERDDKSFWNAARDFNISETFKSSATFNTLNTPALTSGDITEREITIVVGVSVYGKDPYYGDGSFKLKIPCTIAKKPLGTFAIDGDVKYGSTLAVNDANLDTGGGDITYQWSRIDEQGTATEIAGATEAAYTIKQEDIGCKLKVTATAANVNYEAAEYETASVEKADGPAAPGGGAVDDDADTFTFTKDSAKAAADYEYSVDGGTTWKTVLDDAATGDSVTISIGELAIGQGGLLVRVKETDTHQAGENLSNKTAFTANLKGSVSIEGEAVYGETLTAKVEGTQENAALQYEWKADNEIVGTESSYQIAGEDIGKQITVTVTAEPYPNELTAAPTGAAAKRPVTIQADSFTKKYGQKDPELTWKLTSGTLSGEDALNVLVSRTEGENAGSYDITLNPATVGVTAYYEITCQGGSLTIDSADASLTITVQPTSLIAGKEVALQVEAKNTEQELSDSGWKQPWNVTVKAGEEADAPSVTLTSDGKGVWTGTYQVPADTATGTLNFCASFTDTNYNTPEVKKVAVSVEAATYTLEAPDLAFDSITYGQDRPEAQTLAITNKGNSDSRISSIALTGDGADSFVLTGTDVRTISPGVTDTSCKVQPKANLSAGSYEATVKVTYTNNATVEAAVSFTVEQADTEAPEQGYSIDYKTEQITIDQDCEVFTAKEGGQEIASGGKLSDYVGGELYIRRKAADENHKPSEWVSIPVKSRPATPAAPAVAERTSDKIVVETADGQEYRLGENGEWQDAGTFTGLLTGTDYKVYTRIKATKTTFASEAKAVSTSTRSVGSIQTKDYAAEYVYTGQPITAPVKENFEIAGDGAVTFAWYKKTDTAQEALDSAPTEPGDYILRVSMPETEAFTGISIDVPVQISYLKPDEEATVSEQDGNDGWYVGDAVIKAPDGYKIVPEEVPDSATVTDTEIRITEDGKYTVTYRIADAQGHMSELKSVDIWKDSKAPSGTITMGTSQWKAFLNAITFGIFAKDTVTITIDAEDAVSEVAKIELYESDRGLSLEEVKNLSSWIEAKEISVTPEDSKQFVYYARITDKAGNATYLSSDGTEFDTIVPAIEGAAENEVCYLTRTLIVSDKHLDSVTLQKEETPAEGAALREGNPLAEDVPLQTDAETGMIKAEVVLDGNVDMVYTITATDKAGNISVRKVVMKTYKQLLEKADELTGSKQKDKKQLEEVKEQIQAALETADITQDEKTLAEEKLKQVERILNELNRPKKKHSSSSKSSDTPAPASESISTQGAPTGDRSMPGLYLLLILFSIGVVFNYIWMKRKKTQEK